MPGDSEGSISDWLTALRTFYEINRPIFEFGYGLSFFVMGLVVALQSRRSSRLALARTLGWLAAFGLTHGLFEWGEHFAPVHEAVLNPAGIEALHSVHLILLSASLACLFMFGAGLMRAAEGWRWLSRLAAGLLAGYFLVALFVLPQMIPDPIGWHNVANALARYLIGFPGALLAAYGLRVQAHRFVAPLEAPHIVTMLRAAGIGLLLYAVFGGLIPPPIPVWPGSVLNTRTFEQALGVPPLVVLSFVGLLLAVTIIRALEVFDLETERRIEAMEQQQILTAERERIARELHDGAIQTVYTAGLLVESAQRQTPAGSPLATRLDKAAHLLNDAIGDLRRNLGELKAAPAGQPLAAALRQLAEDPRFQPMVEVKLEMDLPAEETLAPARTDHVLAIAGEAMANVVRHAQARQVVITARRRAERLELLIQDDGVGFDEQAAGGYGLRNMADRARLLGGRLNVASAAGQGTTIRLDIPWSDER